jgi:hypothetical protein
MTSPLCGHELVGRHLELITTFLGLKAPRKPRRDGEQFTPVHIAPTRHDLAGEFYFERVRGVSADPVAPVDDGRFVEEAPDRSIGIGELNLNPTWLRFIAYPSHCLASDLCHEASMADGVETA